MIRNDLHHYKYSTATFFKYILAVAILSIQIHFCYKSFLYSLLWIHRSYFYTNRIILL